MKPNFLIIGAAKCATSSVCHLLRRHPDIFVLHEQTAFFAKDEVFGKGFGWYESLFEGAGSRHAIGECSNEYTQTHNYCHAPERIAQALPGAKLVYMVRDPLSRIESLWLQIRSHGGEQVHHDFNRAVRDDKGFIDSTNYWRQIEAHRAHGPGDRILVLFFEDFAKDTPAVMGRLYEFLGVDPCAVSGAPENHKNPSRGKRVPPAWFSRLRALRAFRAAKHLMPGGVRTWVKEQLVFTPSFERPTWQGDTRKWVLDQLREDSLRLLEYAGKPSEFWSLD